MKRVIGIGGIFFKAKDPQALSAWYKLHLGVDVQEWGGAVFDWQSTDGRMAGEATAWRITNQEDASFSGSTAPFMVNYLVDDLPALMAALRAEGCEVVGEFDEDGQGKFGWVIDPEGNKVELCEPFRPATDRL